jgi:hypothetical protein
VNCSLRSRSRRRHRSYLPLSSRHQPLYRVSIGSTRSEPAEVLIRHTQSRRTGRSAPLPTRSCGMHTTQLDYPRTNPALCCVVSPSEPLVNTIQQATHPHPCQRQGRASVFTAHQPRAGSWPRRFPRCAPPATDPRPHPDDAGRHTGFPIEWVGDAIGDHPV